MKFKRGDRKKIEGTFALWLKLDLATIDEAYQFYREMGNLLGASEIARFNELEAKKESKKHAK
jgi:mannose/cellobiose epimerase-like protein (N-acyl-D-glucosamine 2-epimerase family)